MSIEITERVAGSDKWDELRATPAELRRIRAGIAPMRPLRELVGGPVEPASPEEVADLEDWLDSREKRRHRDAESVAAKLRSLDE